MTSTYRLRILWIMVLGLCQSGVGQGSIQAVILGHANDFTGASITKGSVGLINMRVVTPGAGQVSYKFDLDPEGTYRGIGVVPGIYAVVLNVNGKLVDYVENVELAGNRETTVDFDMRRKEYQARLSPERLKANSEYMTQLGKLKSAQDAQNLSKALNSLLKQARDRMKQGDFSAAAILVHEALEVNPDEGLFWYTLADAELGAKHYDAAIAAYGKVLGGARTPFWSGTRASAENNLGIALAESGKTTEAEEAYEAAAKYDPPQAGTYFLNEAFLMRNLNQDDAALLAVNKSIAANPRIASAYYVRAQELLRGATVNPRTHKLTAPVGCVAAYRKYLELEPAGKYAAEVKEVLAALGSSV